MQSARVLPGNWRGDEEIADAGFGGAAHEDTVRPNRAGDLTVEQILRNEPKSAGRDGISATSLVVAKSTRGAALVANGVDRIGAATAENDVAIQRYRRARREEHFAEIVVPV